MLKDKNGNTISVGSRVKLPDGSTAKVRGTIVTSSGFHNALEVEVVTHKEGDHDKAADGDSIIWGS